MAFSQKEFWERERIANRRPPTHPVVEAYVQAKLKHISKSICLDEQTSLLDVGCGNGFFTYYFDQRCKTTGVDFSQKMVDINPVENVQQMDAADLQFEDRSFDVVFCHALLHHVEDPDRVVQEMVRVSRRHVVILEPNRNNPLMFLFCLLSPAEREAMRFSLGYVRRLAERNGVAVRRAFSHGIVVTNKLPTALLPLFKPLDIRSPLGMTHVIIGEREA